MRKIIAAATLAVIATSVQAELVQQFRDPTFSGNGWATQVLTLEQMRQGAEQQKKAKEEAAIAQAKADAANTPLAKFMALFQTQVYSQVATQLTNSLFQGCASGATNCTAPTSGQLNVSDTQQLNWLKSGGNVTLTVYNGKLNPDGSFTRSGGPVNTTTVPVGSFAF